MIILLHTKQCYTSPHVFTITDETLACYFGPYRALDTRGYPSVRQGAGDRTRSLPAGSGRWAEDLSSVSFDFAETITTRAALREVLAEPNDFVTNKEVTELDEYCRDFIARSPFILIASSDGARSIDISPKGDPAGFVQVLDDTTLAIPDRLGNHRAGTFENMLRHPFVGVIFLIPGTKNTFRVRGRARIVRDIALRESMEIDSRVPELALVVDVATAYFHCASASSGRSCGQPNRLQPQLEPMTCYSPRRWSSTGLCLSRSSRCRRSSSTTRQSGSTDR